MHDQTGLPPQPARRPADANAAPAADAADAARRSTDSPALAERLEGRTLMAVQAPVLLSPSPNINITRLLENQNEATIAIDRSNPGNLFMASVNDSRGTGALDDVDLDFDDIPDTPPLLRAGEVRGLIGARSEDGGLTWVSGALDADIGESGSAAVLPPACCDPSVAFDDFGNLFATFINRQLDSVFVAVSTDLGRSFEIVGTFTGLVDQPTVVTGPNSVWVTFQSNGLIVAAGARVLGPGAGSVQEFTAPQHAPRSEGGNFGDIAIGPNGEVMVTYQILREDPDVVIDPDTGLVTIGPDGQIVAFDQAGPAEIYVNVDPDGFGPQLFGKRFKATDTNVGTFDPIPAQEDRTIDSEAGLAWDRSGGPFNGRVWMVYTNESRDERESDLNIYVRFSDDLGQTWSSPRNVNDEDVLRGSQFLPRIALDQTTGNIAVTWHDARERSANSFRENDETRFWGTVGVPTATEAGVQFADNIQISTGFSDAHRSRALLEYGDYTGLDFHNNVFYPVWADNSNSTGDNPSGGVNNADELATFDVYTARVQVIPVTPATPEVAPVGPGSPLRPDYIGRQTVTKGKTHKFQVRFESDAGIDIASLDDQDLLVTGPKGYNLFADFLKAKRSRGGTVVTGTYQAFAPGGKWDQGDNGLYSVLLQQGAVSDLAGTTTAAGTLDQFLVSSTVAPQSPLSPANMPAPRELFLAKTALDAGEDDDEKLRAIGL